MKNRSRSRHYAIYASAIFLIALSPGAPPSSACDCADYKEPASKPSDYGAKEGLEYMRSSAYRKEFKDAIENATKACRKYLREHPDEKHLAIVSDIDETALDNSEHFGAAHENFDWPTFKKFAEESKAPPLKKTAAFLKWARKQGFAIFLVTGRPEELRKATIKNLISADIAYDGLFLRPTDNRSSAISLKSGVRKSIEDMGFTVVVNLGDQVSDLVGGYAVDCEKLPNKLYFVK